MVTPIPYDEGRLLRLCADLNQSQRARFTAACAQYLWPLVDQYLIVVAAPAADRAVLSQGLSTAWDMGAAGASRGDLMAMARQAEDLVPEESPVWADEVAFAQNGIAAIAYALRSWLKDDPQEAVWAARQLYEAGDYRAQTEHALESGSYSVEYERRLAESPVVKMVTETIYDAVAAAKILSAEEMRCRILADPRGLGQLFGL